MIPVITLTMEGATMGDVERCRKIIHSLFTSGAFAVRNGEVIMRFDNDAVLGEILINQVKYKRNKPESNGNYLSKLSENIKIEMNT